MVLEHTVLLGSLNTQCEQMVVKHRYRIAITQFWCH